MSGVAACSRDRSSPLLRPGGVTARRRIPGWTFASRTPQAAIQLGRDDLTDMLAHEPDHVFDDTPFAIAIVAPLHLRLLVLNGTLDPFADQTHDGIDEPFFAVTASPAAVVAAAVVAAMIVTSP